MWQAFAFTDKGPGLIRALEAAGYRVREHYEGGTATWQTLDDPAAVEAAIAAYDPLPDLKAARHAELAAIYAGKIAAGRIWNGTLFQIDPESQANIAAMGSLAASVLAGTPGAAPWPEGFYWVAADNGHVPMDAAVMFAFAQAIAGYVSALILTNRALKDAIDAAADATALAALDLTAGWPA